MEITFMDMVRESLRPIVRAVGSTQPDAQDSRFAARGRLSRARGDDGSGAPVDEFNPEIGRRFDFHI